MSESPKVIVKPELHIRFSEKDLHDLVVPIHNHEELSQIDNQYLRQLVRNHNPSLNKLTRNKRLRFIYNGRPVTETTNFYEPLQHYIHSLTNGDDDDDDDELEISSKGKEPLPADNTKVKVYKIFIHCFVGVTLSAEELAEEDLLDAKKQKSISTTPVPVGFDRLLSAGFSQNEVDELRQQFQSMYGATLNQQNSGELDDEFDDDDENDEVEQEEEVEQTDEVEPETENENDIRQLEERWIESTANDPNIINDPNARSLFGLGLAEEGDTSNRDLLIGVLLGAFLGVLSIFLMKSEFKIFSKRTRTAIVAGIMLNFSFAVLRQMG